MKINSPLRNAFVWPAAILIFLAGAAAAENPARRRCEHPLTIEALRAVALHHSPLVAEVDSVFAEGLAHAIETELPNNPELQVEQTFTRQRLNGDNDNQLQAVLSQPIRISDFGTRERVGGLIRRTADSQRRMKLLELTQKLVLQARTLKAYQEIEKTLLAAESRASKKVRLINDGVNKGLLTQGDELLFEGEMYRLQAQAKGIASTIATLQNELTKSIGLSCAVTVDAESAPTALPSEAILIEKAAGNELSESSRAELLSELSKERARLAELDAVPQFAPRFVYEHTNDGGDYIGAGISIPLPIWNRNQAERTKARAEQRTAELKERLLKNGGLEEQISNLRRAAARAEEQAEIYSKKVVPAFSGTLQSQEKLYGEGKGNVLQVWQTLRAFNEVQTQAVLLALEAASARIQLSLLVGEEV